MRRCAICGRDTDQPLEIQTACEVIRLESFECAVHLSGPCCTECGWPIEGHCVMRGHSPYCCIHVPHEPAIAMPRSAPAIR